MTILDRIKDKARISTQGLNKIVFIPSDVKSFVCSNEQHLSPPDQFGNRKQMKILLNFASGRMNEITCELCGTIYKKQ